MGLVSLLGLAGVGVAAWVMGPGEFASQARELADRVLASMQRATAAAPSSPQGDGQATVARAPEGGSSAERDVAQATEPAQPLLPSVDDRARSHMASAPRVETSEAPVASSTTSTSSANAPEPTGIGGPAAAGRANPRRVDQGARPTSVRKPSAKNPKPQSSSELEESIFGKRH